MSLIDEVLKADAEMTAGPWTHDSESRGTAVYSTVDGRRLTICRHTAVPREAPINAAGIALYRTAAPKLARAYRIQMEGLRWLADPCPATAPAWFEDATKDCPTRPASGVARYMQAALTRELENGDG